MRLTYEVTLRFQLSELPTLALFESLCGFPDRLAASVRSRGAETRGGMGEIYPPQ